jgi:hypothetical protein
VAGLPNADVPKAEAGAVDPKACVGVDGDAPNADDPEAEDCPNAPWFAAVEPNPPDPNATGLAPNEDCPNAPVLAGLAPNPELPNELAGDPPNALDAAGAPNADFAGAPNALLPAAPKALEAPKAEGFAKPLAEALEPKEEGPGGADARTAASEKVGGRGSPGLEPGGKRASCSFSALCRIWLFDNACCIVFRAFVRRVCSSWTYVVQQSA